MPEKNSARFDDDPDSRTAGTGGEDRRPEAGRSQDPRSQARLSQARLSKDDGPGARGSDARRSDVRASDVRGSDVRRSDVRESDVRESEDRATEARTAEEPRHPERPAHEPRRPEQRRTDEQHPDAGGAERRTTDEHRGDDEPGAAPALRKPAAEPVIPRQPTGSDALDSRPGIPAASVPGAGTGPAGADTPHAPGLWLETAQVQRLSAQWRAVQTGFVDDPRAAVEQADDLVGKAADLIAESVGENRRRLRAAGGPTEDSGIPTEELRLAMREYRTLLDRLLAS
ncbi:hypothetical protein GCM10018781_58160 [Kitasatospora indigofera]|uniref:Uncharacterized protein n=1 Tax=Kitasatospora indigofera TaxID=67307 RepID=A0A919G935_9ACTN|nr:hypothetical protein [Kitasatospora indigofera]GHH79666.1 hypothetical protein GCM10018781_58160 [Kitasatospora indigofera]